MKKITLIFLVIIILSLSIFSLYGCNKDELIALSLENYQDYIVVTSTISDLCLVESETESGVNTSYCTFVLTLHASKRNDCELHNVAITVKRAWMASDQLEILLSDQGAVNMSYPCHDTIAISPQHPFSTLSKKQYKFEVVDVKGYVVISER